MSKNWAVVERPLASSSAAKRPAGDHERMLLDVANVLRLQVRGRRSPARAGRR